MLISYNGQSVETKHYLVISDSEFESLKEEYYKKPDFKLVQKDFMYLANGYNSNANITNYYVKDLMVKTRIYFNKWSIEDVFNCKELLGYFISKVQSNEILFDKKDSLLFNIEKAFRLGGKGIASKPSNFPLKTIDYILQKYNINNNWYDYSCGWGARLTGALKHKVNYYGTDPNYLLTERLKQLSNDYKTLIKQDNVIDIRTQGSEHFVNEWQNKMGLAFSSPPYFYLEDYKIGDQSYKEGTSYDDWKNNYYIPTMQNVYSYLIDTGYFLININNYDKFDLVGDSIKIAEQVGFKYLGYHTLENISRINSNGLLNDNNEKILVFVKNNSNSTIKNDPTQLTLF